MKMDSKEDILNVEIDPEILLSYELVKLSLESFHKDLFVDLPDEITKDDNPDIESSFFSTKSNETITSKIPSKNEDCKNTNISVKLKNGELSTSENQEVNLKLIKSEKDINGNEEVLSFHNLNESFVKLELSDSGNEYDECEEIERLVERGSTGACSKTTPKKTKKNRYYKRKEYDKNQISAEKLRFWSGSSVVDAKDMALAESSSAVDYAFYDKLPPLLTTEAFNSTFGNYEMSYDDSVAKSLGSPESGYDTSSISGCSPPPQFLMPTVNSSFDLSLDDQTVIDVIVELENTSDYALPVFNLPATGADEKDCVGKLVDYLKDNTNIPEKLPSIDISCTNKVSISANDTADLNFLQEYIYPQKHVLPSSESDEIDFLRCALSLQNGFSSVGYIDKIPVPINNDDSSVESSYFTDSIQQKMDSPKKITIKPLENKAKNELRQVLSKAKLLAANRKIYRKIIADKKNNKQVNIIYVEDELDKASEDRTNLHNAVRNSEFEEIYALIEVHKQYNKSFSDLNNRDKSGKTALDYAIEKNMRLVVKYLRENMACRGVNV